MMLRLPDVQIDPSWLNNFDRDSKTYAYSTRSIADGTVWQIPAESLLLVTDVEPGIPGHRPVWVSWVDPKNPKRSCGFRVAESAIRPTRPVVKAPSLDSLSDDEIFLS